MQAQYWTPRSKCYLSTKHHIANATYGSTDLHQYSGRTSVPDVAHRARSTTPAVEPTAVPDIVGVVPDMHASTKARDESRGLVVAYAISVPGIA
eukprot:2658143-Rhodomonas_salina.2